MTSLTSVKRIVKTETLFNSITHRNRQPYFKNNLLYRKPSDRFEPSYEDRQWWAQNSDEPDWDAMATESRQIDRLCRGPIF